jgi:GTP-binding protein
MGVKVHSAEFLTTATRREEWPAERRPELAFVGRSNVGKSSMLNALAGRSGLARVSNSPGRTRALQFFDLAVKPSPAARTLHLRFCDLPGYGHARVSKAELDRWARMIEQYLRGRQELRAVVLIVDGRHPPAAADAEALAFLSGLGKPVVVAATKIDKLAKSHRFGAVRAAERGLSLPAGSVVPFSAVERTGSDALWARLLAMVGQGGAGS